MGYGHFKGCIVISQYFNGQSLEYCKFIRLDIVFFIFGKAMYKKRAFFVPKENNDAKSA